MALLLLYQMAAHGFASWRNDRARQHSQWSRCNSETHL